MLTTRQIGPLPTLFERKMFATVKYAAAACRLSFNRIKINAEHLITEPENRQELNAQMIIDCWHIIDSARRIHKTIWTHRSKFTGFDLSGFLSKYSNLKKMRDYVQHIDRHLDGKNVSHFFMGSISFCERREADRLIHLFMATAIRSGATEQAPGVHVEVDKLDKVSQFFFQVRDVKVDLETLTRDCENVAIAIMDGIDSVSITRPGAADIEKDKVRDDMHVILRVVLADDESQPAKNNPLDDDNSAGI